MGGRLQLASLCVLVWFFVALALHAVSAPEWAQVLTILGALAIYLWIAVTSDLRKRRERRERDRR